MHSAAGKSVAAIGARGLRITKVRYVLRRVQHTRRLRMIVTVKDRRGLLVRGALVRVLPTRLSRPRVHGSPKSIPTNRTGLASFSMSLSRAAFGKRVAMIVIATTPSAKATMTTSVHLPSLGNTKPPS